MASMTPLKRAAATVIKRFQDREIAGLTTHLRQFGPLPDAAVAAAKNITGPVAVLPNPFLPKKNPKNNKWRAPKYSLRRQADLVKLAQAAGMLHAIPPSPKKFAAELRMERVKVSLGPIDAQRLEKHQKRVQEVPKRRELSSQELGSTLKKLKTSIETSNARIAEIEDKLKALVDEEDVALLHEFQSSKEQVTDRKQRDAEKAALQKEKKELETIVFKSQFRQTQLQPDNAAKKEVKAEPERTIVWAGEVKERKVPGSELGTRLYTGKKRMFKGHLWERKRARRARRHSILMRDMAARIERYKSVRGHIYLPTSLTKLKCSFLPSTTRRGNQIPSNLPDTRNHPNFRTSPHLINYLNIMLFFSLAVLLVKCKKTAEDAYWKTNHTSLLIILYCIGDWLPMRRLVMPFKYTLHLSLTTQLTIHMHYMHSRISGRGRWDLHHGGIIVYSYSISGMLRGVELSISPF